MPKVVKQVTMTGQEGAALYEVDRKTFLRIAADAGFTVRALPNMAPRFIRAEVEAYLAKHTIPGAPELVEVAS